MAALPTRELGAHGPEVTALGFGLMSLSGFVSSPAPRAQTGAASILWQGSTSRSSKVKISKEEEKEIRALVEEADVKGHRYPEMWATGLFVDTVPEEA